MYLNRICIIGASAGGPRILKELFQDLPALSGSIVVIQHMPKFVNQSFSDSLDRVTQMKVKLAEDGEYLKPGEVYIAPSEMHLGLVDNRLVRLFRGEKVHYVCPSIDISMESLKYEMGIRLLGILLTGMGDDGAEGIAHIKDIGGITVAQDQESSVIWGMPKAAIATGKVDFVLSPREIKAKMIQTMGILRQ